jgi:hypothetical protein
MRYWLFIFICSHLCVWRTNACTAQEETVDIAESSGSKHGKEVVIAQADSDASERRMFP